MLYLCYCKKESKIENLFYQLRRCLNQTQIVSYFFYIQKYFCSFFSAPTLKVEDCYESGKRHCKKLICQAAEYPYDGRSAAIYKNDQPVNLGHCARSKNWPDFPKEISWVIWSEWDMGPEDLDDDWTECEDRAELIDEIGGKASGDTSDDIWFDEDPAEWGRWPSEPQVK